MSESLLLLSFRVVDFLVDNWSFDYSKRQIARGVGVGDKALSMSLEEMEKVGWIVETKKGRYKLNGKNKCIKEIMKIELELIKKEVDKNEENKTKKNIR